ncbi:hypothetical protein Q5P01_017886 [Channa striata]|uniref:Uncharacterized protein n=1 Tax=Channa striata TaxID=64152 RepID=A0AA88S7E6_CHASR|nr:hypothetical protein Q5P01_017886 [Channa striata]
MQRGRAGIGGGFDSELFGSKLSATPGSILSAARFRGKLGAAIAVITSLIVGFLTMPNNILYFIDSRHGTRGYGGGAKRGRPEYEYIHAGIALITLGCLAMVVSIVLSFFAATSKRKMDDSGGEEPSKSTRTVFACLIVMNVELFMSVEKQDEVRAGSRKDATEIAIAPNSSRTTASTTAAGAVGILTIHNPGGSCERRAESYGERVANRVIELAGAIELFRKPSCCHSACNDVGKCQTAMLLFSS